MQKISPFLWFDKNAEEAVKFYISVFKDSKILNISRYGSEGFEVHGMSEGTVMTINFEIEGVKYTALNGGPHFKFNEAVSFVISCKDQQEIDYYWQNLSEGGDPKAQNCGWLKDKFGLSWQIIPANLGELLNTPDRQKSQRAMKALLQMKKLIIEDLKNI